jgi:hypothetical protein
VLPVSLHDRGEHLQCAMSWMNIPLTELPCQRDSWRGETEQGMIAVLSKNLSPYNVGNRGFKIKLVEWWRRGGSSHCVSANPWNALNILIIITSLEYLRTFIEPLVRHVVRQ